MEIIFEAIDLHNHTCSPEMILRKSTDQLLIDEKGCLDSLASLTLLVQIETLLSEKLSININVIDESKLLELNSPYKEVSSLVSFIIELIHNV